MIFPRDVFTPIKSFPIAHIILAHNHPSGDPSPSEDDVTFTKKMKEASELLGIELLDHIILTKKKFISLKEHKLL
jgi:DNA repair protein RadC